MENENNNQESARSIYDVWLHSIFQQLESLKTSIFLAREGFSSLQELSTIPQVELYLIRERNFKFCLILFESLLNDLKSQLKEEFYDKQIKLLKDIKNKVYSNIDDYFYPYKKGKVGTYYPTKIYYVVCGILETERAKLIQEISPLLYAKTKPQKNKPI